MKMRNFKRFAIVSGWLIAGWMACVPVAFAGSGTKEQSSEAQSEAKIPSLENLDARLLSASLMEINPDDKINKAANIQALASMPLSERQRADLISSLRRARPNLRTEKDRRFFISGLYEYWGQLDKALEEMKSNTASLHRVRLLLKLGRESDARAEVKAVIAKEARQMGLPDPATLNIRQFTYPYIAAADLDGLQLFLSLLEKEMPPGLSQIQVFSEILDLQLQRGTLAAYTAQLKKKRPALYACYLQRVERYQDALQVVTGIINKGPISSEDTVTLTAEFSNLEVMQKAITKMINSGDGSDQLRRELMKAIIRGMRDSTPQLTHWLDTHPKEMSLWAKLFTQALKHRPLSVLRQRILKELAPNPWLTMLVAIKHDRLPLRKLSRDQVQKLRQIYLSEPLPSDMILVDLYHWRASAGRKPLEPYTIHYKNPSITALRMINSYLPPEQLLLLIRKHPEFAGLKNSDKAIIYAMAGLDGPFLSAMLSLDWASGQYDHHVPWLAWYLSDASEDSRIPLKLLQRVADKMPAMVLGGDQKRDKASIYADAHTLISLLLGYHPDPGKLAPEMSKLVSALRKRLGEDAAGDMNQLSVNFVKKYPMVNELLPATGKVAQKEMNDKYKYRRVLLLFRMFNQPDIKRLRPILPADLRRSRLHPRQGTLETRVALHLLRYPLRNVFWGPRLEELEKSVRAKFPDRSPHTIFYDLLAATEQSENGPEKIYQFLDALPKDEPDWILLKVAVQLINQAPGEEVIATVKKLAPFSAPQRKRVIDVIHLSVQPNYGGKTNFTMNEVTRLLALEEPVGRLKLENTEQDGMKQKHLKLLGDKLAALKRAKKGAGKEAIEVAREILEELVNGGYRYVNPPHRHAAKTLVQAGVFEEFAKKLELKQEATGVSLLDRLLSQRLLHLAADSMSIQSARPSAKMLEYAREIIKLAPDDLASAKMLWASAVKADNIDEIMRCARAMAADSRFTLTMRLSRDTKIISSLNRKQLCELMSLYLADVRQGIATTEYNQRTILITEEILKRLQQIAPDALPEMISLLRTRGWFEYDASLLGGLLQLGRKKETLAVCAELLFPGYMAAEPQAVPLRFFEPRHLMGTKRSLKPWFELIDRYQLAADLLKMQELSPNTSAARYLENRLVLELLATPTAEHFAQIKASIFEPMSTSQKRAAADILTALLASKQGAENLALAIYMSSTEGVLLEEREVAKIFLLSHQAGNAELVEQAWVHFDSMMAQREKAGLSTSNLILNRVECLLATMKYGTPERWKQLMAIYTPGEKATLENPYYLLKHMVTALAANEAGESPPRSGDLLAIAMKVCSGLDNEQARRFSWLSWALIAARCGDAEATQYFYTKVKQRWREQGSSSDQQHEELEFWINYFQGEVSAAVPVVFAKRQEGKWRVDWSLAGVGVTKSRLPNPANIIVGKTLKSGMKAELTVLAGVRDEAMQVVKKLPADGVSGSLLVELPEGARYVGLMVRQLGGAAILWARPVRLNGPDVAGVKLERLIPKGNGVAEILPATGPFHTEPAMRIRPSLAGAGDQKHLLLGALPWVPGDPVFASAWISDHQVGTGSLLLVFQDAAGRFLGDEWLGNTGYIASPQLTGDGVPRQWRYVTTDGNINIPAATQQIMLAIKLRPQASSDNTTVIHDIADVRCIQGKFKVLPKGVSRLGRVPGQITGLAATADDDGLIVVTKEGEVHFLNLKTGKSELRIKSGLKTAAAAWVKVRKNLVFTINADKHLRIFHLTTGKELGGILLPVRNVRRIDATVSADGKWIVLTTDEGRIQAHQMDGHRFISSKLLSFEAAERGPQFKPSNMAFNQAGDLILQVFDEIWKYEMTTGKMIRLSDQHPNGLERFFLHIDRPHLLNQFVWVDPVRRRSIHSESHHRSRGAVNIKSSNTEKKLQLDSSVSAFTLLLRSGAWVYADPLGIIWKIDPDAR